jgi:beta-xylosidase
MYDDLIKRLREDAPTALANCDFDFVEGWIKEAADAIEELVKDRDMYDKAMTDEHNRAARLEWDHRWIPVTERLPYESVFVHGKGGELVVAQYSHKHKWWEDDEGYYCDTNYVTHWMPLPEPPKEGT